MASLIEIANHPNYSSNVTTTPKNYAEIDEMIDFQYYAWSVAGTTIAALGLVGNILSIIVLAHRRMKSATSCYLIALSVYDCLVLFSLVLFMALPIIHIKKRQILWYFELYPYLHPFAYPLALTAQTCSIYTTVGFTVERYIAVCFPLKAASWCTIPRARKGILVILLSSILYNIPRMLEYRTDTSLNEYSNKTEASYNLSEFGLNPYYRHIYLLYLHMVIMLIIPFTVLAVLNLMLIRAVRKSQKTQGKITNKQNKENNLTIMLISVIVVFLICQVPSIADNILAVTLDVKTIATPPFVKLTAISSLFVIMNSATNFYLYCLFGHKFRRVFYFVLCSCFVKSKRTHERDTIILRNSLKHQYNNSLTNEKEICKVPVKQKYTFKTNYSQFTNASQDVNCPLINNNTTQRQSNNQLVTGDPRNKGQTSEENGKACMVTRNRDEAYYTVITPSDKSTSDVEL